MILFAYTDKTVYLYVTIGKVIGTIGLILRANIGIACLLGKQKSNK